MTLHPLIGHEELRRVLSTAHSNDALPASLLLHGARGVGKQHLALWLARLLVCDNPGAGPCESCGPCRMAASLEHPDIHWYFPLVRPKNASGDKLADALETARHEELAEVRANPLRPNRSGEIRGLYLGTVRNIRARAYKRSTMAEGPVFIIGQAELLVPQEASPEAANALLKILEEPPGSARFILTSSEPGLLLPTILSRSVSLHVGSLSHEQVSAFLRNHTDADDKVIDWAAALGQGSPGRAMGFLPVDGGLGPLEALRRRAFDLVMAATASTASAGYGIAISFPPARARELIELFSFVEEWLRDLGATAAGAGDMVFNRDALPRLTKHCRTASISAVDVPAAFATVERARELARGNVNPQLIVTGMLRDLRAVLKTGHSLAGVTP